MATDEVSNLPYVSEYAKTGRSSCRKCKDFIEKAELRIALMVQSRKHDGKDAHWFHFDCFFQKQHPKTVGDFAKFETLRWEDQQKITSRVGTGTNGTAGKGKVTGKSKAAIYKDFGVEYAKSSRSACVACEKKIEKSEIRISKLDHESDKVAMVGAPVPRYHHVKCFLTVKDDIGFDGTAANLPGFKQLEEDDQKNLLKQFASFKPKKGKRKLEEGGNEGPAKLAKHDAIAPSSSNGKLTLDEKIKKQNDKMYQIRDILSTKLDSKLIKQKDLKELLSYNGQDSEGGKETLLDRLSDVMTFGALERCKKCDGNGQIEYRSGVGYQCTGNISEYTRCLDVVEKPPRKPFKIPEALDGVIPGYKFKQVVNRAIPVHAPVASGSATRRANPGFVKINETPLKGFSFVVSSELPEPIRKKVTERVKEFKGKVQKSLEPTVLALISTKAELKKGVESTNIAQAQQHDVPVVTVDFITSMSTTKDVFELMKEHLVSDWTVRNDLHEKMKSINRHFETTEEQKKKPERALEKKGENVKLLMKGGCVVDPDCQLADTTHVYKKDKLIYSVVLKRTDIDSNKNSFYKMQVLEDDKRGGSYHVFRSWGRIGSVIGGKTTDENLNLREALDLFNSMFEKHTGGNVFGKKFVMKPKMYMLMDIAYEAPPEENLEVTLESKLAKSVQELVCLIFDVKKMMDALIEFELDTNKMPLGKISRDQLLKGFTILNSLMTVLENATPTERRIVDYTNQFFSVIPHNFGLSEIPLISTTAMVHEKVEMLQQLMDIELAYEMIRDDRDRAGVSVDNHYLKLNSCIEPVEKMSTDYVFIEKYLKNTHGATHSTYALSIREIFKVQRHEEIERFAPYREFPNRQLLWHGSRTTNFAGILSQGLRIAPPEAPATGYMFGKGVYFADMVSKSANYCHPSNDTGLLLLCEVALGTMAPFTTAKESLSKAPKGHHSVFAVGQTRPDPNELMTFENGIKVPYGPPVPSKVKSDLLYNEYIVYDVAQVRIRYILNVNFEQPSRRRK